MATAKENLPERQDNNSTPDDAEVRAHVRAYFSMLEGELRGRRNRRHYLAQNGDDEAGQVYRQIAAILIEEGLPFHSGYPPLPTYAIRVRAATEAYLRNHPEMLRLMETDVDEAAGMVPDMDGRELDQIATRAPEPGDIPETAGSRDGRLCGVDFLEREQRNQALASCGEMFVLQYEIERLRAAGAGVYADAIEHVSAEQGAGGGYDIHSYDADGRDRYIKVKTTRYRRETPFFVTANEIAMAAAHREHFWLYRVYDFRREPRLYAINGALQDRFRLEPTAYRATPR